MSQEKKNTTEQHYDAGSIKVLEGLEGVRKRPGMYIGNTDIGGLHHLVYEVVDNSIDEAMAGHCNKIEVELGSDGSCLVKDNGRGIPVDIHKTEKISAAEVVMTKLHAGGKFSKDSYKFSGGLHGVGVSVVNALSSRLELNIFRENNAYYQLYQCGKPMAPLAPAGSTEIRGTWVKFWPDPSIFSVTQFNFETLVARFRELAFLNPGVTISICDLATGHEKSFLFEGGIVSFIEHINKNKTTIFPKVVYFKRTDDVYELELSFQYNDSYVEQTYSFVNNIRTAEGGTHEAGLRSALTKIYNKYAQNLNLLKDKEETSLSSDDVREGLVCVLSIKVPEPQFEGQTKNKLGNGEVKGLVDSWIYAFLDVYFEENPNIIKLILQKAVQAQQARLAAKRARELTRRKSVMEYSVLPGKLADCSDSNPANTEIYIVEGDSAGGSAKGARSRFYQAILPIRGKIINVEKTILTKILSNNEIRDLITAIGAGVGNAEFDLNKVRYHKIVIMTDADVDGAHIRILLLTFFFRYMRPLIDQGYLFIAQPPLYKAKAGKQERYLKSDSELKAFIFEWGKENLHFINNAKELSTAEAELLLNSLFTYQEELSKSCTHLELTQLQLHEMVKVLHQRNYKVEAGTALQEIVDWLQCDLNDRQVSLIEKTDLEDGAVSAYLNIAKGKRSIQIPSHFFISQEFGQLLEIYAKIAGSKQQEWTVVQGKTTYTVKDILDLDSTVMRCGKDQLTLQRYKGLGEMNADQLWDTTMDPERRVLLQVSIDDALKADQSFADLMGDSVDARKAYIEEHAHFVRNLDI